MLGDFASGLPTRNLFPRFSSRFQSPVSSVSLKTRIYILRLTNIALSRILLIWEFINSFLRLSRSLCFSCGIFNYGLLGRACESAPAISNT